jgi:hypothetical protein
MTKQQHPVTPSWEQIDKWKTNRKCGESFERLLIMAAQWGADQELKACCEAINGWFAEPQYRLAELRAARRPKPPSLKQQALDLLKTDLEPGQEVASITLPAKSIDTIRQALETLPND